MIDRIAVRNSASNPPPKHAAVAGRSIAPSTKEVEGVEPIPKDRGAEQGHVDGLFECSFALGMVAAEARLQVARHHAGMNRPTHWRKQ